MKLRLADILRMARAVPAAATALTAATTVTLALAAIVAAPAAAQQCSPATGGSPCEAASGVASLGDPGGSDLSVGNPIHPITGNKYQEEIDSPPLPGPLGLEIRRHFNSSYASADSAWGKGWSLSYDTRVHRVGSTLQIVQADGRRLIFHAPARKSLVPGGEPPALAACESVAPGQGQLFMQEEGYRWIWPQQRELIFDGNGHLIQIRPSGAGPADAVRIARAEGGRIARITDPAGRSMDFAYDGNGRLNRIIHPLGQWQYRINATGQVQLVRSPDGINRRYRYEDIGQPSRFTAITIAADEQPEQVLGRWAYDAQGRAMLYRRADGGELKMAFQQEAAAAGETVSVLTNALGSRTTFRAREIGGKWRVTEIRGPGCEECGPTNVRMRYDRQAQLLARWKINGSGMLYQRDQHGRVVRILAVRQVDKDGAPRDADSMGKASLEAADVHTQPGPGETARADLKLLQRLEYPDPHTAWPSVLARPSVVAGKEHRLEIRRDDRGNVIELTESGYAPGISAQADGGPAPILRTVRLRYQEIAGKHVLVELDGPLPNGTAGDTSDSDITRIRYDDSGTFALEVDLPGGARKRFASRDAAGRPTVVVGSDGFRMVERRLVYNLHGQVLSSSQSGWLLDRAQELIPATQVRQQMSHRYDRQGRPIERTDAAGRALRIERDAAGRLAGVSDMSGYRSLLKRDLEGQLRVAGLHEPGSEEPLRAAYYGRNQEGRLQSMLLPDGRQFRFHYDANGHATGFTDGDRLLRLTLPGIEPDRTESDVVDDFGQVLKQRLPDHGTMRMRHDEAGRLVQLVDATGVSTDYRYDAAGRLLQSITAGGAEAVAYRYEGELLVAVDDSAQSIQHLRDAFGRILRTSTRLTGLPGGPLLVSWSHDPLTGQVVQQGLADGQSVRTETGSPLEGGTARILHLRSAFWTSVGNRLRHWLPVHFVRFAVKLIPEAVIVQDVQIHPFNGVTGFTHGNGIRSSRQFDPAGRTSRIRHGGTARPIMDWRYRYRNGPRLASVERLIDVHRTGAAAPLVQRFTYDALGRLQEAVQGVDAATAPVVVSRRFGMAPPLEYDSAGRVVRDARFRYSYSRHEQLETVKEIHGNKPVAAYVYNHRRQRTMKTVYDEEGNAAATVFYLWTEDQLVAEVDPDGTIRTQYLSLNDGRRSLPIAKLERMSNGKRAMMAIHTDHRGAPVAMTDSSRKLVWEAYLAPSGQAAVRTIAGGSELNLRLPGQYLDAETGLHDNWHRSYDPVRGRYLQPDPLGYPDGPDAYVYAGGDPVNRVDPAGLYEIDVHYYMSFFLGVTAGLDPQEARIVALAAQYVDNNPLTRPVDATNVGTTLGSVLRNQRQLLSYHFVLSGADGRTLPEFRNSRLSNTDSPQLQNLMNAVRSNAVGRNGRLQFLGEYLHALADTYSHRDADNLPYDALFANCGVGHGHALHEPDLTYDDIHFSPNPPLDDGQPPTRQSWRREARTLEMELNLHGVLLTYGDPAKAKSRQEIEPVLQAFNAIRESENKGIGSGFSGKIAHLQTALEELGFGFFELGNEDAYGYSERGARANRVTFLRDVQTGEPLNEVDFPGTCLEGGTRCAKD